MLSVKTYVSMENHLLKIIYLPWSDNNMLYYPSPYIMSFYKKYFILCMVSCIYYLKNTQFWASFLTCVFLDLFDWVSLKGAQSTK